MRFKKTAILKHRECCVSFQGAFYTKAIYRLRIALLELINEYSELSEVREEKTSSSDMEAMYSFRFWQR